MSVANVGGQIENMKDNGTVCYYCVKHCGPHFCMLYALEI